MVNESASSSGRKKETSFHAQQGAYPNKVQAHYATAEKMPNPASQLSRTPTKMAILSRCPQLSLSRLTLMEMSSSPGCKVEMNPRIHYTLNKYASQWFRWEKNLPCRLMCLNTWSLVCRTFRKWVAIGQTLRLIEQTHCPSAFCFLIPVSKSPGAPLP